MKTVTEIAKEAGIRSPDLYKLTVGHMSIDQLERFAEIVRADAIADEREACANLVFDSPPSDEYESPLMAVYIAIKARGTYERL